MKYQKLSIFFLPNNAFKKIDFLYATTKKIVIE